MSRAVGGKRAGSSVIDLGQVIEHPKVSVFLSFKGMINMAILRGLWELRTGTYVKECYPHRLSEEKLLSLVPVLVPLAQSSPATLH